jgi:hypothetical protein
MPYIVEVGDPQTKSYHHFTLRGNKFDTWPEAEAVARTEGAGDPRKYRVREIPEVHVREGDYVAYRGSLSHLQGTPCLVSGERDGKLTLAYLYYNDRIHQLDVAYIRGADPDDVVELVEKEVGETEIPEVNYKDGYYRCGYNTKWLYRKLAGAWESYDADVNSWTPLTEWSDEDADNMALELMK